MVENGTAASRAEARSYYESTCEAMKGPPCRMLAYYLEQGLLGDYAPERLKQLMARACAGNDEPACGDWERVEDTFNP